MKISVLGSGSAGNCSFIEIGSKKILVDVGYSMKKIEEKLGSIGENIKEIDAIFITHDHSDHIKSLGVISRKYDIPFYVHEDSINCVSHKLGKLNTENMHILKDKKVFLDNILVENFDVMHDSAHNLGYNFIYANTKLSYVTDIGKVTNIVKRACMDADILAFESNYDVNMLLRGDYPLSLKARVNGNKGHISNDKACELFRDIKSNRLKKLFLLHLSQENNDPELCLKLAKKTLGNNIDISLTSQEVSEVYKLIK